MFTSIVDEDAGSFVIAELLDILNFFRFTNPRLCSDLSSKCSMTYQLTIELALPSTCCEQRHGNH